MSDYPQQRRIGCSPRLLIAAVILIIGAISYYFTTQKNPITGETQRVKLTPDQETQLGLQAAPEMAQEMGGEMPMADRGEAEVKAMGLRLASALPKTNPYPFDFHLLADQQTVNAFALPGGQVFITRALYTRLQTEGQLAGVLGHEIGHVVHRHAAQQMAHADFYNSIVMATGVGTGDNRAAALAQYVTQIRSLKYSRDDELEADAWGLKLMAQIGFDPREMLRVMEILKSVSGSSGSEMMSTHPLPQSRIDKINEQLAQLYPTGVPKDLIAGHALP
ncbi:MAG TPA: M48 family metalloprotease [Phycisphaerae bacterium]|nr:M48 family metalloprotease [Phycisphaerae bacterium]